jgi:hypothetical protein
MTNHVRADGRARGKTEILNVPLRPALAAIPTALEYLGGPSRSKFYEDLLPQLEIVRFGNRTFVTIASLDRLIAANRQAPEVDWHKQAAEVLRDHSVYQDCIRQIEEAYGLLREAVDALHGAQVQPQAPRIATAPEELVPLASGSTRRRLKTVAAGAGPGTPA